MKNIITLGIALICVMLFAACDNIINKLEIDMPVESGYGRININLVDDEAEAQQARTVMPPTVFDKYVYTFTKAGEAAGTIKDPDNDGLFTLEIGNYTVAVSAYKGNEEPYTLVANGVSLQFGVGSGNNNPVEVLLTAVNTIEQGIFSYTITYPVGAKAEIFLQKWPELNVDIPLNPDNVSQGNGKTQMISLEAGTYMFTVLVSKSGLYAGISEAIHINSSLATTYTKNYGDDDFIAVLPITINDYIINGTGTFTYDGEPKSVSIAPKPDKSPGEVTVWYEGIDGTSYAKTTNAPVNVGVYIVTFDVAEAYGFNTITGLPVGELIIAQPVTFNSVTANGDISTTTTQLTLTFNQSINGLTANDISLNGVDGVQKGTLSGTGPSYTLPISGFIVDGTLSVEVEKIGFDISGSPQTVDIYYTPIPVTFESVSANGSATVITTQLTLTFSEAITGLTVDDITLSGVSGVEKGALSGSGPTYILPVNFANRFASEQNLNVSVSKLGYNISGSPQTVTVYASVVSFSSVTANGGATANTTQLTLTFSHAITGLSASDITISGVSGVTKGTFSSSGSTYTLRISGFIGSGTLTVAVLKAGYTISPSSRTVAIYYYNGDQDNATSLTENIWTDGSITTGGGEAWYSFYAAAGTTYRIWWNARGTLYGDGTKTLSTSVRAYDSNGTELFNSTRAWDTASTITLTIGSTIYLRVTSLAGGTGTFAIGYSTGTGRSALRIRPPTNTTVLTANQWRVGSITASVKEIWYSFNATANTTYGVWWNDTTSDAVDIQVRAYDSNGNLLFWEDSGYTTIHTIKVTTSGTIYLRVLHNSGITSTGTGNFSITYSAGIVRPDFLPVTTLTENQWIDGSITTGGGEAWYSFYAAAGTTYRIWWNESGTLYGDGTKTLNTRVRAYDSNGTELFNSTSAWGTASNITLTIGSTIYLRVTPQVGGTGTFAIVYSTGTTRP